MEGWRGAESAPKDSRSGPGWNEGCNPAAYSYWSHELCMGCSGYARREACSFRFKRQDCATVGYSFRKFIGTFKGHRAFVCSLSLSRTGNLVATGAVDGSIKVWALDS